MYRLGPYASVVHPKLSHYEVVFTTSILYIFHLLGSQFHHPQKLSNQTIKDEPMLIDINWDVMDNPIGDCSQTIKISLTKSASKFNMMLTGSMSNTCQACNSFM